MTVFGESAGSASTNFLMMSPMANGTFRSAILQSGVVTNFWAYAEPDKAERVSLSLAQSVRCADETVQSVDDTILACMRGKDVMGIVSATSELELQGVLFSPTSDDEFFPYTMKEALEMEESKMNANDVIIGFNRDEATVFLAGYYIPQFAPGAEADDWLSRMVFDGFVLETFPEAKLSFVMDRVRDQYFTGTKKDLIQLLTDQYFRCKIAQMAMKLGKNRNVYTYVWDVRLDMVEKAYPYMGAGHGLELTLLFGRPWINPNEYSDEERQVANMMINSWLLGICV